MAGPAASLRPWPALPARYADRQVPASPIDAWGRLVALLGSLPTSSALAVVFDGTEVPLPGPGSRAARIDVLGDGFVVTRAPRRRRRDHPLGLLVGADVAFLIAGRGRPSRSPPHGPGPHHRRLGRDDHRLTPGHARRIVCRDDRMWLRSGDPRAWSVLGL